MNLEQIRSRLYANARCSYNLTLASSLNRELVIKMHESYLDGVDGVINEALRTAGEHNKRNSKDEHSSTLRQFVATGIDPGELRALKRVGRLNMLVNPGDEIDIPLNTGVIVTAVCGFSNGTMARFIFKDCVDESPMYSAHNNTGGYQKSEVRRHILHDIYPSLPKDWRDVIISRRIVDVVDDNVVEYNDPMWIPSATDVFGASGNGEWIKEIDSFRLPIFEDQHIKIKMLPNNKLVGYWLRSAFTKDKVSFVNVSNGSASVEYAKSCLGVVPGFDV